MNDIKLIEHQVQLLRTEVNAMQKEINEVLTDIQTAMQGMMRGTKLALEVFDSRIRVLEDSLKKPDPVTEKVSESGREI